MALSERRLFTPEMPVSDLVRSVRETDGIMNRIRDHRNGTDVREEVRRLRQQRNRTLLSVLEQRQSDPYLGAEITVVRYGNEEYHQFSQNKVIFNFPNLNPYGERICTALDLLGEVHADRDPRAVLELIGDPDVFQDESPQDFLMRTHEEIRKGEREWGRAKREGNEPLMESLDGLRLKLVQRALDLRKNALVNLCISRYGKVVRLHFSEDNFTSLLVDDRVDKMVEESGGVDFVKTEP